MGDSVMQLKGPEPNMRYMIVFSLLNKELFSAEGSGVGVIKRCGGYFKIMYMASSLNILILLLTYIIAYNDI